MKIYRASIWHEVGMLVLYCVLSPSFLARFHSWHQSNETAGILVIFAWLYTGITAFLSWIFIFTFKRSTRHFVLEYCIGLIPLAVFTFLIFVNKKQFSRQIMSSFLMSNSVEILVIYSISIIYKLVRRNEED